MSKKRNSVFSGVVPVLGTTQTIAPLSLGAGAIVQHAQHSPECDPTLRYSTGSTLLDSFVQDAELDAFALQTELTALSFELKRISSPRLRSRSRPKPTVSDATASDSTVSESISPESTALKPAQGAKGSTKTPSSINAIQAKREAIAQARQQAQQQALKALQQAKQQAERQKQARSQSRIQKHQPLTPQAEASQASPLKVAAQQVAAQQVAAPRANLTASPQSRLSPLSPTSAQPATMKVYGGADYKTMQARAQAGGLINLDDALLFGGADQSTGSGKRASDTPTPELDFLVWPTQPLEDYTLSPIPGGWHPTAHICEPSETTEAEIDKRQTVLGLDTFKLSELEGAPIAQRGIEEEYKKEKYEEENNEAADLDALNKQITYLNQRIEFLSKKLAEITDRGIASAHSPSDRSKFSSSQSCSSVVLKLETFNPVEENRDRRLATLDSFSEKTFSEKTFSEKTYAYAQLP